MTDNKEYAIVPKVPTDEMLNIMDINTCLGTDVFVNLNDFKDGYVSAISAAPPHNLVAVDKGELVRVCDLLELAASGGDLDNSFSIEARELIKELLK